MCSSLLMGISQTPLSYLVELFLVFSCCRKHNCKHAGTPCFISFCTISLYLTVVCHHIAYNLYCVKDSVNVEKFSNVY